MTYKLDLTRSKVWTNFVLSHAFDDIVEASENIKDSSDLAGIINVHNNQIGFYVYFTSRERAFEFLLRWG